MLEKQARLVLGHAKEIAAESQHVFVTTEHLLLSFMYYPDGDTRDLLEACGIDLDALSEQVETCLADVPSNEGREEPKPTNALQRVIQRAVFHAQASRKASANCIDLLVALFSEGDSNAVFFLNERGLDRLKLVSRISHADLEARGEGAPSAAAGSRDEDGEEQEEINAIERFTVNLNEEAAAGRLDPLVGRDAEIQRMMQILVRRRKSNPLLVGEAGVGKTALAEGMAQRIVQGKVPNDLTDACIYMLDIGALLAGTRYRGDFEERLKQLLLEIKEQDKAILFVDEAHTLISSGASSTSTLDSANLIKPALAKGELRCIAATTFKEYRSIFERDHALARRFQKIDISEPSEKDTLAILKGVAPGLEKHHGLRYTAMALKAAVDLSVRFITDRLLPDKAIDVLDETAANVRLQDSSRRTVSEADVQRTVATMAKVPTERVSEPDRMRLSGLRESLKRVIFGQDRALDRLVKAIQMARAGLRDGKRPIGSFLFSGPTGVGKTESARQLAASLGVELIRFDMSEYMERHTVSRLIGAPPGYVGYDQGGLLIEAVTRSPHAVLLLDEIEKAHPDIFNLLLQVMDHGTLTDNYGRKANFTSTILIMTSNAGAEQMAGASYGFRSQDHSSDGMRALEKTFSPEFRNRLDAIIQFGSLQPEIILTIVDKNLVEVQALIDQKSVILKVDAACKTWLAEHGYDEKMGARPLRRLVREVIQEPLASEMLFGELVRGGEAAFTLVKGKPQLKATARADLPKTGKKQPPKRGKNLSKEST